MRTLTAGLVALGMLSGAVPAAAQSERPIRTWTQEMTDKAEFSLNERRDCRSALTQANAAYDRARRSRQAMDPRIPLVKARAHDCLGQIPPAIAARRLYDQLTGLNPADDESLGRSCQALAATSPLPADSADREATRRNLLAEERATQGVLQRAAVEAGRSDFDDEFDQQVRYARMAGGPDGTLLSKVRYQALWPSYVQSWAELPSQNRYGYRTNNNQRYYRASTEFGARLASIQAKLICLDLAR